MRSTNFVLGVIFLEIVIFSSPRLPMNTTQAGGAPEPSDPRPAIPFPVGPVSKGEIVNGGEVALDSYACENCTFRNVVFTYGGGSFKLINCILEEAWGLELTGAAANSAFLWAAFTAAVPGAKPTTSPPKGSPLRLGAKITKPVTINIESPYGPK